MASVFVDLLGDKVVSKEGEVDVKSFEGDGKVKCKSVRFTVG